MYRKLGRDSSARKALFRSMLTSFFQYERIETTEAKAKELRSLADQMVTLAKRGDLHARRQVLSYLMDESVVKKLFDKDIVVHISDGVLCETEESISDNYFTEYLKNIDISKSSKAIADDLYKAVLRKYENVLNDDVTIIVTKIKKVKK